jgi:hypothetical protein
MRFQSAPLSSLLDFDRFGNMYRKASNNGTKERKNRVRPALLRLIFREFFVGVDDPGDGVVEVWLRRATALGGVVAAAYVRGVDAG